uniref:Uncharacterized protein n=1 Tax=Trichogramma kaykai TaxID=54128 RepID=A0ABD2X1C8_9HYME
MKKMHGYRTLPSLLPAPMLLLRRPLLLQLLLPLLLTTTWVANIQALLQPSAEISDLDKPSELFQNLISLSLFLILQQLICTNSAAA